MRTRRVDDGFSGGCGEEANAGAAGAAAAGGEGSKVKCSIVVASVALVVGDFEVEVLRGGSHHIPDGDGED